MSLEPSLQQAIELQVNLTLHTLPWIDKDRERARIEEENNRRMLSFQEAPPVVKPDLKLVVSTNGASQEENIDEAPSREPSKIDVYLEAAQGYLKQGQKKEYVKLLDEAREDPIMTDRGIRKLEEVGERFALKQAVASAKA